MSDESKHGSDGMQQRNDHMASKEAEQLGPTYTYKTNLLMRNTIQGMPSVT